MIFQGDGFWKCFGIVLLILVLLSAAIGFWWNKKTPKVILLNAEALRNPTNTGITTSTLGITLLILSVNVPISKLTNINVALLFLMIATIAGLWNISSMATVTDENGKIPVGKNQNVFLVVMLVFQFGSLLAVFVLLAKFDFSIIKPAAAVQPVSTVYIQKPRIGFETTRGQILESWGAPNQEVNTNGMDTLWYETPQAVIRISMQGDKLKEIKETAK
jgi:hypothetical protein